MCSTQDEQAHAEPQEQSGEPEDEYNEPQEEQDNMADDMQSDEDQDNDNTGEPGVPPSGGPAEQGGTDSGPTPLLLLPNPETSDDASHFAKLVCLCISALNIDLTSCCCAYHLFGLSLNKISTS